MKAVKIDIINDVEQIICNKCGIRKPKSQYKADCRTKHGIIGQCNSCKELYFKKYNKDNYEKRSIANKEWHKNNPEYAKQFKEKYPEKVKERNSKSNEKRKEYFKEYNMNNKDKQRERSKIHYQKSKERKCLLRIENRKKNMPKIRETMRKYVRRRAETEPIFKIELRLRCRTRGAFKAKKWKKNSKTQELLGESFQVVAKYIERKFTKGMNWKNYGKGKDKWNVDHIIPLSSATTEKELVLLCHYRNLQPLWEIDNNHKSDSMPNNHQLTLPI